MRSDIAQGDGMFKSIDAGKTWQPSASPTRSRSPASWSIRGMRDVVFVAALGHPYGPNAERGVFRSRDGGAHWAEVLGTDATPARSTWPSSPATRRGLRRAVADAAHAVERLSAVERPRQRPLQVHRWRRHWTRLAATGLPATHGRVGIAIAPREPARVYAIVDASTAAACIAPTIAARIGARRAATPHLAARLVLRRHRRRPEESRSRLRAEHDRAALRRRRCARSIPLKGDPTGDDFHELWIDPSDADRQILGVDQGAIVTMNGGTDVEPWHNQPTGAVLSRHHGQPFSVLRLRRAAGFRRGGRAEPQRRR